MDKRWRNLSVIIIIIIAIAVLLFVPIELPNDVSNGVPSQTVALESVAQKYNFSLDTLTFANDEFDLETLTAFEEEASLAEGGAVKELVVEKISFLKDSILFFEDYLLVLDATDGGSAACVDSQNLPGLISAGDVLLGRGQEFNSKILDDYSSTTYTMLDLSLLQQSIDDLEQNLQFAEDYCE